MAEPIYSPGLEGIVAGETAISTIAGGLRYRGYAVEELAQHATFEEVAYLIWHGELPRKQELEAFHLRLGNNAQVHPPIIDTLRSIPADVPMMDVLRSGASLLGHWDIDVADNGPEATLRKSERLFAQLPVILAARHRLRQAMEPVAPDKHRSFAANLLWMLTRREPSPRMVRALEVTLILYAEHEFNASTFAARVVTSTLSDVHSSVTAAIGALKGPLHGGANERAMEVLQTIGGSSNAERWIRDALARKERIMGFGHRVYKTGDPRAAFLKPLSAELAGESGNTDMETSADIVERIVREEKGLPPNLDWPAARIYHYLGLPVDLYTPLFVISRVLGWSAHVMEQLANNRLIRPLSRYTGQQPRAWIAAEQR